MRSVPHGPCLGETQSNVTRIERRNGIQLAVEIGARWAAPVRGETKDGHITGPCQHTAGWDQAHRPRAVGRGILATYHAGSLDGYLTHALYSTTTTTTFSLTMPLPPNTHEVEPQVPGNQEQALVSMYVDTFRCISRH